MADTKKPNPTGETPKVEPKVETPMVEDPRDAEIRRLRAMLDAATPTMRLKQGASGTVVVTGPGLSKYGATFYPSAWLALLAFIGAPPNNPITGFIRQHKATLAWQGEVPANL